MLFKNKQKLNKKFIAIIFAMICLFAIFPTFKNSNNVNAVSFGSGTIGSASSKLYGLGTTASPFEIWKYSDLVLMMKNVNENEKYKDSRGYTIWYKNANYILMENINTTSAINPIGNSSAQFGGTFNGNGKSISVTVKYNSNANSVYYGIFGYNSGTIQNLTVQIKSATFDLSYYVNDYYFGGICGHNTGTIKNCSNKTEFKLTTLSSLGSPATNNIGGICGKNEGTIKYCTNYSSIEGLIKTNSSGDAFGTTYNIGGICGKTESSTFDNCINYGNITAEATLKTTNCGGILGIANSSTTFNSCLSKGNIYSYGNEIATAGGMVGFSSNKTTIKNSANEGNITSGYILNSEYLTTDSRAGGLVGNTTSFALTNVYSNSSYIKSNATTNNYTAYAGGLIGYVYNSSNTVTNAYFKGSLVCNGGYTSFDTVLTLGKKTSFNTTGKYRNSVNHNPILGNYDNTNATMTKVHYVESYEVKKELNYTMYSNNDKKNVFVGKLYDNTLDVTSDETTTYTLTNNYSETFYLKYNGTYEHWFWGSELLVGTQGGGCSAEASAHAIKYIDGYFYICFRIYWKVSYYEAIPLTDLTQYVLYCSASTFSDSTEYFNYKNHKGNKEHIFKESLCSFPNSYVKIKIDINPGTANLIQKSTFTSADLGDAFNYADANNPVLNTFYW